MPIPDNSDETGETGETDDGDTTSTQLRWRYSNDVLAGALIGTVCAAGIYDLVSAVELSGTIWTALSLESGLAATWAFGVKTVEAVKGLFK